MFAGGGGEQHLRRARRQVAGWAGAIQMGIARALVASDPVLKPALKRGENLLTRDARMKERKKAGLKRARKAPQFTKR